MGDNPAPLSFGFKGKPRAAPAPAAAAAAAAGKGGDGEARQLITAIDARGQLRAAEEGGGGGKVQQQQQQQQHKYIVPRLENTFQAGVGSLGGGGAAGAAPPGAAGSTAPNNGAPGPRKFVPSFKPPTSTEAALGKGGDRFEAAQEDTRPKILQYGLQTRAQPEGEEGADDVGAQGAPQGQQQQQQQGGGARAGRAGGSSRQQRKGHAGLPMRSEDEVLEQHVQALPEEASLDVYEDMPIEEFGKAMLRGMGWTEGMGVGRNRKQAQPIEYLKRPERLGLGAASVADKNAGKKKVVKMGDKPAVAREDMVLAPDADGRQRHIRTLDEKLVHRSELVPGPRAGKAMHIVGGRHKGLACRVVQLLPQEEGRSSYARVTLLLSNESIDIRCSDLEEEGQQQQQQQEEVPPPRHSSRREDGRGEEAGCGSSRGQEVGGQGGSRGSGEFSRSERGGERGLGGWEDRGPGRGGERGSGGKGSGAHERGHRGGEEARGEGRHRSRDGSRGEGGGGEGAKRRRGESPGAGAAAEKRARAAEAEAAAAAAARRRGGAAPSSRSSSSGSEEEEEEAPTVMKRSWLAPYIKVRIIDKRFRGGRLYLKKGTVVDVHPGGVCDVAMDEGKEMVQAGQAQLETVVPKELGAAVLVVVGPLRGQKARLHAKSGEACVVQLEADLSVQRLLLDEVAMYVGPMDE